MADSIEHLEGKRAALLKDLANTGDLRRGSITETYRPCGKADCACTARDHPGHGPFYAFTRKVGGKTQSVQLRPGARLTKLEREVESYRQFRQTCQELVDVNETLCALRPVDDEGESAARRTLKKIPAAVQTEVALEVERIVNRVLQDRRHLGHLEIGATEFAIRDAMHRVGRGLLEELLNADHGGHCGQRIACGKGHQAEFIDYRTGSSPQLPQVHGPRAGPRGLCLAHESLPRRTPVSQKRCHRSVTD